MSPLKDLLIPVLNNHKQFSDYLADFGRYAFPEASSSSHFLPKETKIAVMKRLDLDLQYMSPAHRVSIVNVYFSNPPGSLRSLTKVQKCKRLRS